MASINKKLKQALDVCIDRCKTHDEFMFTIYQIAKATLDEGADPKESLTEIMKLCDPAARNAVKKVDEVKEERTHGHVHGGEELRSKEEPITTPWYGNVDQGPLGDKEDP